MQYRITEKRTGQWLCWTLASDCSFAPSDYKDLDFIGDIFFYTIRTQRLRVDCYLRSFNPTYICQAMIFHPFGELLNW